MLKKREVAVPPLNIIFPTWFRLLSPPGLWRLIVLNYLIDGTVFYLASYLGGLRPGVRKTAVAASVLTVVGFAADFTGAVLGLILAEAGWYDPIKPSSTPPFGPYRPGPRFSGGSYHLQRRRVL